MIPVSMVTANMIMKIITTSLVFMAVGEVVKVAKTVAAGFLIVTFDQFEACYLIGPLCQNCSLS